MTPTPASPPEVSDEVDACLPPALRHAIEQRYWAPIGEASALERFIDDPALEAAPDRHPALFSDHGVVHARDIACSAAALADRVHGTLLAPRPEARRRRVRDLAVLLAWFHDIGMVEPTAAGRRVHPQFAAQTVLGPGFDDLAAALWQADVAGLRREVGALGWPAHAAREVMALALAHSKSAVPAPLLDDRPRLRQLMAYAVGRPLGQQQHAPLARQVPHAPATGEAFAWLERADPFVDDLIDAVRVLRAADALRQRGTTLRTSAGYEVCTDRDSGEAVVGLRTADQRMSLLLRFHNPISAAEANLRSTFIADDGALGVELYRGRFADAAVRGGLLDTTAHVVADIEADALGSFRAGRQRPVRLGRAPDDAGFADELALRLVQRHPRLAGRVEVVAGEPAAPPAELPAWAGAGTSPAATGSGELFEHLQAHGLNVDALDRAAALAGTRCVQVAAGTQVLETGSQAAFVIVPLAPGLVLQPSGGYPAQPLHPWLPLGVTGVVRGGERNACVVAQQALPLLLIPGEHYLAAWFRPYDLPGLRARLRSA